MQSINFQKVEECLNQLAMDDPHSGRRPAGVVAQLYHQTNLITNEQLTQMQFALEQLALDNQIDCEYSREYKETLYFSQKFGSKRDEYVSLLQKACAEAEAVEEAREHLAADWKQTPVNFFERDARWYYAVSD